LVSEDGKTVYVTSEAGDLVHAIDADTGAITRDVVAGLRPRRLAATHDGKELWATAELSGEVVVIDRARFVVIANIAFPAAGHAQSRRDAGRPHHDWRRQDRLCDARPRRPHVAVVDVPTRKVLGYILVGKRSWGITLSRDEKTLYVANGQGDDVTVIDTNSRKAKHIGAGRPRPLRDRRR
jgi:YVTN family beta-propeller protein